MDFFQQGQNDQMTKQEIEAQQKKQHELKLIGHQKKIAGLTLFSYNLRTGEVKIAPTSREVVVDLKTLKPVKKEKIVIEPNCIYRQALNRKNFIKKLHKLGILNVN